MTDVPAKRGRAYYPSWVWVVGGCSACACLLAFIALLVVGFTALGHHDPHQHSFPDFPDLSGDVRANAQQLEVVRQSIASLNSAVSALVADSDAVELVKPAANNYRRIIIDDLWQVTDRIASGKSTPADPCAAVGPDTIIASQNDIYVILDKYTGEEIVTIPVRVIHEVPTYGFGDFGPKDNLIQFDPTAGDSGRFFGINLIGYGADFDTKVLIETGPNTDSDVSGSSSRNYIDNEGLFSVRGMVVATDPPGAETTLTQANSIAVNGNIALIASEDFEVGSATKVGNAFAAGAIAAIIYDNRPSTENPSTVTFTIAGISAIPAIVISENNANLIDGQIITMKKEFIGLNPNRTSVMSLVVSKDSNPRSADDFYRYIIGGPEEDSIYFNLFADFEKTSMSSELVFIQSQDYNDPLEEVYSRIIGLNKAALINGNLPQNPLSITANDLKIDFSQQSGWGVSSSDKYKAMYAITPIGNVIRPGNCAIHPDPATAYFVWVQYIEDTQNGRDDITIARVHTSLSGVTSHQLMTIDIPSVSRIEKKAYSQGNFKTKNGLKNLLLTVGDGFNYRCSLQCASLWCSDTRSIGTKAVVNWYEFDVSRAASGHVSIRQQGRIPTPNGVSAVYGAIDVNVHGEVMIAATTFGNGHPQEIVHYARGPNDPLGEMPIAPEVSFQADYPYMSGTASAPRGNKVESRYNDFTSMDMDADGETFYYYTECFHETAESVFNLTPLGWHTCLVKAHIEDNVAAAAFPQ